MPFRRRCARRDIERRLRPVGRSHPVAGIAGVRIAAVAIVGERRVGNEIEAIQQLAGLREPQQIRDARSARRCRARRRQSCCCRRLRPTLARRVWRRAECSGSTTDPRTAGRRATRAASGARRRRHTRRSDPPPCARAAHSCRLSSSARSSCSTSVSIRDLLLALQAHPGRAPSFCTRVPAAAAVAGDPSRHFTMI